ncbi:hypothetical protein [Chitinophaga pinensis]|uniref:Response regulator n=1 Tax=Chitinophaga pinensis TaxID=79329 RepID=A0A5C6LJH8_9BACT|nr:hypothetical protein [Chitinophaga pinensis]TWV93266.1 hypothetical protein FEF09_27305 [Chitinophaga pinensis]
MAKNGPLLILEDDEDDREIYQNVLNEMGMRNEIIFLTPEMQCCYLQQTTERPLVIIAILMYPG